MHEVDLIIIGAGPAGMSAAGRAADCGLTVLIVDEQPAAGGQIYRDVNRASALRGDILGKDFTEGQKLTRRLDHRNITHLDGAVVWQIEDGPRVSYARAGQGGTACAKRLLLATGALERSMPIPGWTLPGVMTAGAAQILLKQSGIACERAVLVGSGPLLYLIGAQMVRAGVPPLALVETQTRRDFIGSLRHLGGALRGWRYLLKGAAMLRQLRRARVPRYLAASDIAIEGKEAVRAVTFNSAGKSHRIACETVLLHHGVVPNTQTARSIDIPHQWDTQQACFVPDSDAWGRTAQPAVFIAGDGAGIGGAKAAALAGEIAALDIACDLDKLTSADRDAAARPLRARLAKEHAARPFIDSAYPPYAAALAPHDATIVCRCEEVTAGDIRRMAGLGCLGPNQTKAFVRAGMGPCQGRYCGLTVTRLLAEANGLSPDQTGHYRIRPPIKPVTLGEIATMPSQETRKQSK